MKRITFLIIPLIAVSCSKDFLEKYPVSTVSVDALYKTDKDYQDAVVGIYAGFRTQYSNFWQFGDLRGDDVQHEPANNLELVRLDNFFTDNADALLSNSWRNYYVIIDRANTVLSAIESADPAVVVNKQRHTGEARFLRALAYFDLVRIFGDVPLMTAPVTIEEAYSNGRIATDQIYQELIIPDLLAAENDLPEQYTGSDVGRATKGAAKALLGRVYLTIKDFEKAEIKLQEVTTMGYALLDDFNDLFDYSKDEHHSEYIFDIEYLDGGYGLGSSFTNTFTVDFQFAGAELVDELFRRYHIPPGFGGSTGNPSSEFFNLFEPGDLRKDVTAVKGLTGPDGVFIPISPTGVSAFSMKYMAPITINYDGPANWKVIRYADVLLMYAEALNENGKTEEALDYLNQVRERARLGGHAGLDKTVTREKIYTERRLELFLEGHRWFDLVRTGRALDALEAKGMKDYMVLFPIPLSEIQIINDPQVLPQNPGYE